MKAVLRFLHSEDGPVAVEYSVMLAMIIITALSAITTLGTSNNGFWGHIDTEARAAFEAAHAGH
ncbi:MAG: Flp family type IVb pilin [Thermoguttaceae bacterium]